MAHVSSAHGFSVIEAITAAAVIAVALTTLAQLASLASRQNVTDVRMRNPNIAKGCWISNGTNSRAVMRMMTPSITDLVAAAPT